MSNSILLLFEPLSSRPNVWLVNDLTELNTSKSFDLNEVEAVFCFSLVVEVVSAFTFLVLVDVVLVVVVVVVVVVGGE